MYTFRVNPPQKRSNFNSITNSKGNDLPNFQIEFYIAADGVHSAISGDYALGIANQQAPAEEQQLNVHGVMQEIPK